MPTLTPADVDKIQKLYRELDHLHQQRVAVKDTTVKSVTTETRHGTANTGLPYGVGALPQPLYNPLAGGSANTGLPYGVGPPAQSGVNFHSFDGFSPEAQKEIREAIARDLRRRAAKVVEALHKYGCEAKLTEEA